MYFSKYGIFKMKKQPKIDRENLFYVLKVTPDQENNNNNTVVAEKVLLFITIDNFDVINIIILLILLFISIMTFLI